MYPDVRVCRKSGWLVDPHRPETARGVRAAMRKHLVAEQPIRLILYSYSNSRTIVHPVQVEKAVHMSVAAHSKW